MKTRRPPASPFVRELPGAWEIDPNHSSVNFSVKHMMIATVRGRFRDFSGGFSVGEDLASIRVAALINADSIDTGNEERDADLRTGEFLDVHQHPEIAFTADAAEVVGTDRGRVSGILRIKGVSRTVTLDVTLDGFTPDDGKGRGRVAFHALTSFDRSRFGVTWNRALETGGVLVGERVNVRLDIAAVRVDEVRLRELLRQVEERHPEADEGPSLAS